MQPTLKLTEVLSALDYSVFFIITLTTIGFVVWGNYKKSNLTSESAKYMDLMLMGRKLTLPMFIATLVATWYGGIFGVSQIAFEHGIFNFITQGLFWYITYIIFAFFILKKIKRYDAVTLPDLVGQMFGPKSEKVAAIFNIFNLIPIVYTISIGLLLKMIFGLEFEVSMAIGILFVLSYSFIGGFRSVVYSDIFQFFIMLSAVVGVVIISYTTFGAEILSTLPKSYFSPLSTFSLTETLVWGFIALSTLVDPNFYQRAFAAKNFDVAKKGIIISTAIWIIFDFSLTFGAMYARAVIPEAGSENGYFIYALQLLPNGLKGFFLAGICATILSTLDSYLFLAASTVSYDLVPKRLKGKIKIHHLSLLSVALISFIMASVFEGNIKNVWKSLGSISSAAMLVPILVGHIFPKKISDNNFIISSLSGAIATVYWRLSGLKYQLNLDELYIGMGVTSLMLVILIFGKKFSFSAKTK
jgi:solute:Na+ symporter, SSS family